jgi:DNA-binding Lrp family transcriptional regulator
MYPGGEWLWWGTDPRITTTEIASHVGLERKAVWARVRTWRGEGFWDGFEVRPNPRIFGAGQIHFEVPVLGPVQGAELLEKLGYLDGVLWARDGFGVSASGGVESEAVLVALITEDARHVNRRIRILRGLSLNGDLEGPFQDETPACSHRLTPLDWRILAAVSANPNTSPSRLARLVGVTLKTFAQHHSVLIERHAIFYQPKVDWSRLECVLLGVQCDGEDDARRARAELMGRFPSSMPMTFEGFEGIAPGWDNSTCFGTMVPAHSPHAVHALVRIVSKIPGVRRVESETWGSERLYSDWANHRIAEHLAATLAPTTEGYPRGRARRLADETGATPAVARPGVAH